MSASENQTNENIHNSSAQTPQSESTTAGSSVPTQDGDHDAEMIEIDTANLNGAHKSIDTHADSDAMTDVLPSSTLSLTSSTSLPSTTTSYIADPHCQSDGGLLLAFGSGMFGMLGSDDEKDQSLPTPVEYFRTRPITSVAVGSTHALAVGADSSLYSWGLNDDGQRGVGDKASHKGVTEVTALQAKLIAGSAAGYIHSLALTRGGEVFAFGSGEMAALGLTMKNRPKGTPPDLSTHPLPALVRELGNMTKIVSVAAGENHSLALSSSGRVYAVGEGSRGQLGLELQPHNEDSNGGVRVVVFTELASLLPIPIASIAAGSHHSLFVSSAGSVYACGDSSKGRTGITGTSGPVWLPKRITGELDHRHVLQASAGSQYSVFLTQGHHVYACGSNQHGELGLDPDLKIVDTPKRVPGLHGIIQVAAGSTHALARDADNNVWSWGSDENGELGWSESDSPSRQGKRSLKPCKVAIPQIWTDQHIVSVAAGSNTSYIIVAETVLSTAPIGVPNGLDMPTLKRQTSSSSSFQLFTPPTRSLPERGFDFDDALMASTPAASVSPPASPITRPQFVVPPEPTPIPINSFSFSHITALVKRRDYVTLTNYISHCFSSALILNASFLPALSVGGGSYVDTTTLEEVYQLVLKTSIQFPKLQQSLTTSIQKMISSMVLLLKQSRQPPKDLAAYRCIFIALQSPHLLHATASETQLLTDIAFVLTRIPREVDKRITEYIYPHIPIKLLEKRFVKVLLQNVEMRFKSALQGTPTHARLRVSSDEVQSLVSILDSIHNSVLRRQSERANRSIMAQFDSEAVQLIPASAWQIDVHKYIDLQTDLANFLASPPTAAQLPPFSFMRYPYLLTPASKVAYLRLEFAIAMQQQVIGAAISGLNPQLELEVRRSHIVEDTVNALNRYSVWELRRPLKVSFAGEAGEDQGGVSNEFFEMVFNELSRPQYQLWEVRREWKTMWFSSTQIDPSKESLYEILGTLLGMAVYNGSTVQLNLPIWLYSQLLGRKPTLSDLARVDSQLAASLEELMKFEGDIENTFCLTFEVSVPDRTEEEIAEEIRAVQSASSSYLLPSPTPSDSSSSNDLLAPSTLVRSLSSSDSDALIPSRPRRFKSVPLLPDGENTPVTQENKLQYVQLYLDYLFTRSVYSALKPLVEGFQNIVGRVRSNSKGEIQSDTATMAIFTPDDLELLVVGRKELDFNELKRGTRYEGGYSPQHPTIVAFWNILLNEFTPKEQRQFLLFTTGSSRAPVGGLSEVRMLIQRAGPDSDNLPTSSTCFAALLLPEYSSAEKMKAKLKLALANATGFGLR